MYTYTRFSHMCMRHVRAGAHARESSIIWGKFDGASARASRQVVARCLSVKTSTLMSFAGCPYGRVYLSARASTRGPCACTYMRARICIHTYIRMRVRMRVFSPILRVYPAYSRVVCVRCRRARIHLEISICPLGLRRVIIIHG